MIDKRRILLPETVTVGVRPHRVIRVHGSSRLLAVVDPHETWRAFAATSAYFGNISPFALAAYPPVVDAGQSRDTRKPYLVHARVFSRETDRIRVGIRRRFHRSGHEQGVALELTVPWEEAVAVVRGTDGERLGSVRLLFDGAVEVFPY